MDEMINSPEPKKVMEWLTTDTCCDYCKRIGMKLEEEGNRRRRTKGEGQRGRGQQHQEEEEEEVVVRLHQMSFDDEPPPFFIAS